ncbi:MAG: ribonuclease P protein component [Gammaproteobacteria bacterium]
MISARFPRRARLTKPEDYKSVFAEANRATVGYLTMLARRNQLDHPRLGLAISKKHAHSAVARNLIKRATRESFRTLQHQLCGVDVVVLTRPGIIKLSRAELQATLAKLWSKMIERCKKS